MKHLLILASIALTVFCWGAYGPLFALGHEEMNHSRLRPFLCVGLAYFVIAVLIPVVWLITGEEQGGWTFMGTVWSLLAGAVGALGALGIILAFNYGGKPIYVMPLVFGCAPVVNSFWTIYWTKTWDKINPIFYAGLILVAVGAVTVLVSAPRPAKAPEAPATSPAPAKVGSQHPAPSQARGG